MGWSCVANLSFCFEETLYRTFHRCFLPNCYKFSRNQPIRNKKCLWWPCLWTDRDKMSNLYRSLPYMLPTKLQFIWPSGFRGEDFLESKQSETRIACGGHVCEQIGTKWAINLYRRSSIHVHIYMLPTKIRFIWPSGFRGEDFFFRNQTIRNMNCLRWPCLWTDEMNITYNGR